MLRSATDPRWLEVALSNLDRVLVDHAHCEKKAAAQAMALVSAYPERDGLVRRLSGLAIEELRHFREVHAQLRARGLALGRDPGDPYARALRAEIRSGRPEERLVDRLLVSGLIEARSSERLRLLGEGLACRKGAEGGCEPLGSFYSGLARAERGHALLFLELARDVSPARVVAARCDALATREAQILAALPIEPRIH